MNFAEIRARLTAVESGYPVHIHGCFGEVEIRPDHRSGFCHACERVVSLAEVAFSDVASAEYEADVSALLKAFDDAEDRIATLEDGGAR